MARPRRTAALAATGLLAAVVLAGCSDDDEPAGGANAAPSGDARTPAPVGLPEASSTPARVGVLLAVSTRPGQGQDVLPGAQGARVASYRLGLDGGTAPELVVEVDDGTEAGARRAMEALVEAGVSGVVVASTGDHLTTAVAEAAGALVPVLLPYWRPGAEVPDGAWVTGPSAGAVDQRLQDALDAQDLERAFVVTGEGVEVDGVTAVQTATFRGNNPVRLLERIDRLADRGEVDSVVVGASAATQARIVTLLQGDRPDLPVVLTPEALSPVFAETLVERGGTTSGRLTTVGADAGDATTLTQSPQADSAASYFAALRLAAGDPAVTDLLGEEPMSAVAGGADTASHDAVVALARAVAEAGSADSAAVLEALSNLSLGPEDGLAGPPLDFTADPPMSADHVVVLQGTTQDPGVRPSPPLLSWFAVPADG